jgi:hypothetical protein
LLVYLNYLDIMKNKIIILAASLALLSCKKEEKTVIEQTTVEETAPTPALAGKQCYLEVTESQNEGKTTNDSLMLNFERNGDSITGEFKWLPYYKDKKTGMFTGTVNGTTATTVLTAHGEGLTNKEEFIFDIAADKVVVKMGEMAEGKEGKWMYKDKQKASGTDIPKTDCK